MTDTFYGVMGKIAGFLKAGLRKNNNNAVSL